MADAGSLKGWRAGRSGTVSAVPLLQPEQEHARRRKWISLGLRRLRETPANKQEKAANEAAQRVGAQVHPALDKGKSMVQDLANQASEAGKQAMGRAGELLENVAPQAREAASNLYERGSQSGEYVRQYAVEQPLTALLIAGAIGYGLGYLIHRR